MINVFEGFLDFCDLDFEGWKILVNIMFVWVDFDKEVGIRMNIKS